MTEENWYIEIYHWDDATQDDILYAVYGPFSEEVACAELDGNAAELEAAYCSEMIAVDRPEGYPESIYVNSPETWFSMG